MWEAIGGLAKAQEVNKEVAKYVDVMIGNEEDFLTSSLSRLASVFFIFSSYF